MPPPTLQQPNLAKVCFEICILRYFIYAVVSEAPKFDLSGLGLGPNNEIRLKAGDKLNLPIKITGAPKPTCEWTKNGISLPDNAKVTDKEELTGIEIPVVKRDDSGVYKIKLSNQFGTDEAEIKVIVMDKPGPPESPKVTDILSESCKVSWSPPKDDGACEITGICSLDCLRGLLIRNWRYL